MDFNYTFPIVKVNFSVDLPNAAVMRPWCSLISTLEIRLDKSYLILTLIRKIRIVTEFIFIVDKLFYMSVQQIVGKIVYINNCFYLVVSCLRISVVEHNVEDRRRSVFISPVLYHIGQILYVILYVHIIYMYVYCIIWIWSMH